jgi:dTDP-4-dehydrorhamnose 3,5-epimerase
MSGFDKNFPPVIAASVPRMSDRRGSLTKIFYDGAFGAAGLAMRPRQILHSATDQAGVLRGLHAQNRPHSEGKIIVALAGRMYWVVVDLRGGSGSFGRWQGFELVPENGGGASALQVPAGFAHGCLSLTGGVSLAIFADQDYAPSQGIGIAWNDPELAIDWPLGPAAPILSDEHVAFASFADFRSRYGSL